MPVTREDVEHIAALARLAFSDEQKAKLTVELNEILRYMEQLNSLDTSGVEPLAQVVAMENVFREDVRIPSTPREEILKNAPAHTDEFFKVPKVITGR